MKEHFPYLFWAYNCIWFLIAGYVGILMARQRTIRRQIGELRKRLKAFGSENQG
jgi:CcmD family protein